MGSLIILPVLAAIGFVIWFTFLHNKVNSFYHEAIKWAKTNKVQRQIRRVFMLHYKSDYLLIQDEGTELDPIVIYAHTKLGALNKAQKIVIGKKMLVTTNNGKKTIILDKYNTGVRNEVENVIFVDLGNGFAAIIEIQAITKPLFVVWGSTVISIFSAILAIIALWP